MNLKGIPANLPYLWKVLLKVPTDIRGVVSAGNDLMNDIYHDLNNLFDDLNIDTCHVFKNHLTRIVTFRFLSPALYSALKTDAQRQYFYDQGFIVPQTYVAEGDPGYDDYLLGINTQYVFKAGVHRTAALTDDLINPQFTYKNEQHYIHDGSDMLFMQCPFLGSGKMSGTMSETFNTPWGEAFPILSKRLIASDVDLHDSPMYENFTGLVYNARITDEQTEDEYRKLTLGLFLLFYRGATKDALNASLNLMLGMPFVLEHDEFVIQISDYTPGVEQRTVYTDKNTYVTDRSIDLNSAVIPGAVLPRYTPILKVIDAGPWSDADVDGKSLPAVLARILNTDTGEETPFTIDSSSTYDFSYDSVSAFLSGIKYDTFNVEPVCDFDEFGVMQPIPKVKDWTYYVWKSCFYNNILKVQLYVTLPTETLNFIETTLKDIIPVWATPVILTPDITGGYSMYMNGRYMELTYLGS